MSAAEIAAVADAQWGEPCLGYLAQARLADDALAAMAALQAQLPAAVPLPLRLCPAWSLHITVYGLVLPRWPDAAAKARHWEAIGPACLAALQQIGTGGSGFTLQFDRLAVTPMAIIATATDASGTIARLRAAFARLARHPEHPAPRYDIIHMTLARFAADGIVPPAALGAVAALAPCNAAPVARLEIVRERVYPSLEIDELATVLLPASA